VLPRRGGTAEQIAQEKSGSGRSAAKGRVEIAALSVPMRDLLIFEER